MKNIIKYICLSLSFGMLFTSCDDNEDFTGSSVLKWTDKPVTVTSTMSSYTFVEALIDQDDPTTYSVSISASIAEAQPVDAVISFTQTAGNADALDYSIGTIKIPAGDTTASTNLEVNYTGDIEGSESFTLTALSDGNYTLASAYQVSVTIEDKVNDVLDFTVTWPGEYMYNAGTANVTLDFCEMDFDVRLYSATGAFVQYLGATGACIETGSTLSGLPDGDYFLVLELYANGHAAFGATETVPVSISYNQEYFSAGSFTNTSFNLSSTLGLTAVATINKDGYNFTVTPL